MYCLKIYIDSFSVKLVILEQLNCILRDRCHYHGCVKSLTKRQNKSRTRVEPTGIKVSTDTSTKDDPFNPLINSSCSCLYDTLLTGTSMVQMLGEQQITANVILLS